MFSIDLVGAVRLGLNLWCYVPQLSSTWQVLRQGSFVHKMNALQWTEPDFFEDEIPLQHAIARYHASVFFIALFLNAF
jgi:hypothetical protein